MSVPASSSHFVRLFDSADSRLQQIVSFVAEGLQRGEAVIAVLDEHRWHAVRDRLRKQGVEPDEAIHRETLIVRDADQTLQSLTRDNRIDAQLFERHVGSMVSALCEAGHTVRAYGEMVDLLAARNDYRSAIQLEELWNALAARYAFTLFCGYSAVHFGDVRRGSALLSICQAHSHATASPEDVLSNYLLSAHTAANSAG